MADCPIARARHVTHQCETVGNARASNLFDKGRAEERKALNVIPVRMSEENARANGSLALGHQLGGQPVRAGAAVKNQKAAVGSGQLDAGRIAAEVIRAGPGGGDRWAVSVHPPS
jgi:hypothetical protein